MDDALVDLELDADVGRGREAAAQVRGQAVVFAGVGVIAANAQRRSDGRQRRFQRAHNSTSPARRGS